MADSKDVSVKELCNYCKKTVSKKFNKCSKCDKIYHNSCSSRVLCCELKPDQICQTKDAGVETVIVNEEDNLLLSVTISNEQLITENNNLKIENEKLKHQIHQLEEIIRKLPKENTINPNKLECAHSSTENSLYKNKELQQLITDEVEKRFATVAEDLRQIKLKINNLDNVNKTGHTIEKKDTKKAITYHHTKTQQNTNKPVTPKQKSEIVSNEMEVKQRQLMNELINLNSTSPKNALVLSERQSNLIEVKSSEDVDKRNEEDINIPEVLEENNDGFISPKNRRFKRKTVIGQNQCSTRLKAVNPLSWIFISQLEPDTTIEDVKSYLNDYDIKVMQCYKLRTYSKDIAAFRIGVKQSDEEKMFHEEMWPAKTIIRPYTPKEPRNFQRSSTASLKK